MARMRNKITQEIAEEQCGFVKDKGTRNAIYMIRTLGDQVPGQLHVLSWEGH